MIFLGEHFLCQSLKTFFHKIHFYIDVRRNLDMLSPMNIKCIVACYNANGESDFCFVKVECTQTQYNIGDHYEAAKTFAFDEGYEGTNGKAETMIVFDENDAAGKSILDKFVWKSASIVGIDGKEIQK